jgi:DnaJ-class molecular chaperone
MKRSLAETFVADAPCPDCAGQGHVVGYCCAYCDGVGRVPRGEIDKEELTMKKYRVKLCGIQWDDGKGEYDVSEAPSDLIVEVNALDPDDALAEAMDAASEDIGSLIDGVSSSEIEDVGGNARYGRSSD